MPVVFQASGGPEAVHAGRRPWSGERPSRLGPRQPGQSAGGAAKRPPGSARPRANAARGRRIAKDMGETPFEGPRLKARQPILRQARCGSEAKSIAVRSGDNGSQPPVLTASWTQVRMHGRFNRVEAMKKALLTLAVLVVYILHQDVWFFRTARPLVFGFVPVGLAYHAAYSVLAALLMW